MQNPCEDQPLRFYHGSKVIPLTAGTNAIASTSLSGGKSYFKFIDRKKNDRAERLKLE